MSWTVFDTSAISIHREVSLFLGRFAGRITTLVRCVMRRGEQSPIDCTDYASA
jgi:hypothetical protein